MVKIRTARPVTFNGATAEQVAPCGRVIKVSASDHEVLARFSWSVDGRGYAVAFTGREQGRQTFVKLHRIVCSAPAGSIVDHVNGDKIDCRRENVRLVSKSENGANIRSSRSMTGLKGVTCPSRSRSHPKPFKAAITVNRRMIPLGSFQTAIDAAEAYDRAALHHFGECAATNKGLGLI